MIFGMIYLVYMMFHFRNTDQFLQETPVIMIEGLGIEKFIADIIYVKEKDSLHYTVELKEEFMNLSTFEQFGLFHLFCKQFRFKMMYTDQMDQLVHEDLYITAVYKDEVFEYEVIVSNKQTKVLNTNATLIVNNESVYTESQFMDEAEVQLEKIGVEYVNGFSDSEIIEFARRMFRLVTVDGKDIEELKNSLRLVTNAVMEEFGITLEEYTKIYKKYYLFVHEKTN